MFLHRNVDHKEDCDMKTSLQAWHTWVSVTKFRSLPPMSQKFGRRVRISGGIWLIGATLFLQDRTRWRISKASCSRASN